MISKELLHDVLGLVSSAKVISIKEDYDILTYDILSYHHGHYSEKISQDELERQVFRYLKRQNLKILIDACDYIRKRNEKD